MKKLTLTLVAILLVAGTLMAAPVEEATAHRLAVNFWNTYRPQNVQPVSSLKAQAYDELQNMYVFVNENEGFVIVSADDRVRPVLGYSFDSPFPAQLHRELRYWLNGYEKQIAAVKRSTVTAADPRWNTLINSEVPGQPVSLQQVAVLCATKWDQGSPYNDMCPFDSVRNDRAVVGCVATAMAQIMKRWNHPSCGTGSHSYEHYSWWGGNSYGTVSADFANTTYMWELMPNWVQISTTEAKARALATLSFHCGVSVDMMYGTHSQGGSAAYSSCGGWTSACAEQAFYRYFKYDSTTLHYRARYQYSDSAWLAMIDEDLANGRPMYYDGSDDEGGHAFVLDGSNLDTTYHFNWGWSGYGNGFYTMDNLAPGSGGIGGNATYTFNDDQGAIFGIQPVPEVFDSVDYYDTVCTNLTAYGFHEYQLPVADCDTHLRHLDTIFYLHLKTELFNMVTYSSNTGGFGQMEEYEYCRVDGVVMPDCPFSRNGYNFVGWCRQRTGDADTIYLPGDTVWLQGNVTLYARWKRQSSEAVSEVDDDEVAIWPNPTKEEINFSLTDADDISVYVIDAWGRVVIERKVVAGKAKISLERLPAGTYTVTIYTADAVYKKRIIKQ